MGQKKRMRIKKYEEREAKKATRIIEGIFITLMIITLAFLVVFLLQA